MCITCKKGGIKKLNEEIFDKVATCTNRNIVVSFHIRKQKMQRKQLIHVHRFMNQIKPFGNLNQIAIV